MKRIMTDMKIEKKQPTKPLFKDTVEVAKITPPKKTYFDNESLTRSAVFTSGWRKDENDTKKPEINNTIPARPREERINQTPLMRRKSPKVRKPILFIFFIIVTLYGAYLALNYLEKASVVIVAKHQSFSLDHSVFKALRDADSPIYFEIMIIPSESYEKVVLTESKDVSVKAKGTVTFYNEYSTKSQNLLTKTFIADASGKTYQTDKAITIPGYKMTNGKVIPGQVSVGITAFLPGESYNGNPSNFTISGFKGTDKFKKIYAKGKTPLSGGAQGVVYALSPEQIGSMNAKADSSFKANLLKKVNAEIPKGYILYPDAINFTSSVDTSILSPTPGANVKISGTVSALLLKENDIAKAITKSQIPNIIEEELKEIEVPNLSKLTFSFTNKDQVISKDLQAVSFNLTGPVDILWHPSIDALKLKFIGINKNDTVSLFKSDPGIDTASVTLFPPWKSYLPIDESKINFKVQ